MNEVQRTIVNFLIKENIIPDKGIFQIEEKHLIAYCNKYHIVYGRSKKACGKNGNKKFARRLAGITLLKTNFERGVKFNEIRAGLIYLIENPIFPEHLKVGMTIDLYQRLNVYQTYDPFRRFKIKKYDFVIDRKQKEKLFLSHPEIFSENGEWIRNENAERVFLEITIPQ